MPFSDGDDRGREAVSGERRDNEQAAITLFPFSYEAQNLNKSKAQNSNRSESELQKQSVIWLTALYE